MQDILSKSGRMLSLYIRMPKDAVKGVIQINTGTCIPQKTYWKFAEFLTKNGYISITYDYSDADKYTSDVSHIDWILDIESVFDYILKEYPAYKKYMVGHSSGGQLVGYINNCNQIDKLFLVASANGYIKNLGFFMQLIMLLFWKLIVPFSIKRYGFMNNKILGTNGGFPRNIILQLRSWCFQKDFFVPFFAQKNISSYYHTIKNPIIAYHLADDMIANRKSCEYILNLYSDANRTINTLHAQDFGMKKFGHRGFFHKSAEQKLWTIFLQELEK